MRWVLRSGISAGGPGPGRRGFTGWGWLLGVGAGWVEEAGWGAWIS